MIRNDARSQLLSAALKCFSLFLHCCHGSISCSFRVEGLCLMAFGVRVELRVSTVWSLVLGLGGYTAWGLEFRKVRVWGCLGL